MNTRKRNKLFTTDVGPLTMLDVIYTYYIVSYYILCSLYTHDILVYDLLIKMNEHRFLFFVCFQRQAIIGLLRLRARQYGRI